MRKNNSHAPLLPEAERSGHKRKKTYISHTRFKIIVAGLAALVIIFGAIACHSLNGSADPSNDTGHIASDDTSVDEQQPSSGDNDPAQPDTGSGDSKNENSSAGSKTKQVGAGKYGFLTVPDTWKNFTDPDAASITGDPVKQYCDETGKLIITLNCTEDPQTDAKSAASSCWSQMEQDGAADIQGATVQIADCEAYQVYGYYTDDDVMLVIWVFTDSDGILHYISAEGPIDSVMDAVKLVEKTFTLSEN